MKIFVSQVYIDPDAYYPFSHYFQRDISEALTKRAKASGSFLKKYGDDWALVFNMSAKCGLAMPEIRGPTVFRRTKDVEYTIFLTCDNAQPQGPALFRQVLRELLDAIIDVLQRLEIDVALVSQDSDDIIERLLANPRLVKSRN